MNKQELINFEAWCKRTYLDGKLRSPLHLSGGNEEELIAIFKHIKPNDWVFTTYRSHYHALLKGVDPKWLKQWVLDNKSIHVMNKEHKIFTTAIVGGQLSPALGVALAIKIKNKEERALIRETVKDMKRDGWKVDGEIKIETVNSRHVWCFCGDMTAETGGFHEVTKYARRHDLPITFIVEDNGLSTDTPTQEVWGEKDGGPNIWRYKYKRVYPHYGVGKFVAF